LKTVFFLFFVTLAGSHLVQAQTDFSPEPLEEFRKLTENRVADFQEYLSIIADKNRSMEDRKEAVELTVGLFIEAAKMQVTGKNNSSQRVPIRSYLNKLSRITPLSGYCCKNHFLQCNNNPGNEADS
jgi:hypothetical protein